MKLDQGEGKKNRKEDKKLERIIVEHKYLVVYSSLGTVFILDLQTI